MYRIMKSRKKKGTLIAAFALALCLFASACFAETRVMIATDLHYIDPVYYEGGDALRESAEYGDGKMPHLSPIWLEGLVLEALAQKPDALILAGDQTYNGEVYSHKAISDQMQRVVEAGIAVYAIPGNHDINNPNAFSYLPGGTEAVHSITLERYPKYYGQYGLDQAFSRDEGSFSYAIALSDDLWLMMLDAGIYEPFAEAFGLIEDTTLAWMDGLLTDANEQGIRVLTVTHQSLLPHSDVLTHGYMIINWEEASDLLIRHGVQLNLSGHLHIQHIAEKQGLYDIAVSAFSLFPHQYGIATFADDGTIAYETHTLREAFVPEGTLSQSEAFDYVASYAKALDRLRDIDVSDDVKTRMADFAARVNMRYYAGAVDELYEEAIADEAYELWTTIAAETFWGPYLRGMLDGTPRSMRTLLLEAAP